MRYLKLYESYTKYKYPGSINWNMIKDIKDMSLEYLDEDFILEISIYSVKLGEVEEDTIYRLIYNHYHCYEDWRLKDDGNSWSDSDMFGHIFYSVALYKIPNTDPRLYVKESKELISRIEEAYPNEDIRDD